MPGYHVEVVVAIMPTGLIYFASTPSHSDAGYDVYTSEGRRRYPCPQAVHHGPARSMHLPVRDCPTSLHVYEVSYFFENYHGTVDRYIWRPDYPDGFYVKFEVHDIARPHEWWRGRHYVSCGWYFDAPVPPRYRVLGLDRFYSVMRTLSTAAIPCGVLGCPRLAYFFAHGVGPICGLCSARRRNDWRRLHGPLRRLFAERLPQPAGALVVQLLYGDRRV